MGPVLVGLQVAAFGQARHLNGNRLLLLSGKVVLGAVLSVWLLVLLLLLLLQGHLPLVLLLAQLLLPHVVVLFLVHLVLALLLPDQDFLLQLSIDLVGLLKNVVQFLLCPNEFGDVDVVKILITLIVSILTFLPPVED